MHATATATAVTGPTIVRLKLISHGYFLVIPRCHPAVITQVSSRGVIRRRAAPSDLLRAV